MTTLVFCNQEAGNIEHCAEKMGSIPDMLEQITGDKTILTDVNHVTEEELQNADRAIAMGGDGTVGRVLGRLANHVPRIPVGIIPAGTGNLLADCLGLKSENRDEMIELALATIKNGKTIAIDLGVANGTPFALDIAVGPLAMAVTEPGKTEKNSHGLLSYVRPLLKSMFESPYKFKITADGETLEVDASAIFVTNPQELGIGQKADASTLRDGKLNLFVLNPTNLDDYVGIAMRFGAWFLGNAETDQMPYRIFEVANVTIEAIEQIAAPPLVTNMLPVDPGESKPVHESGQPTTMLDGDVFGHTPVTVSVLPAAIDVYVPESCAV